jgi:flagellar hook-basal body complex protein FliE
MPAIDPSFAVNGADWQVQGIGPSEGVQPAEGTADGEAGFDGMLAKQVQGLTESQNEAAEAARSLADGTASDPESVVMAIERARLAMQLASQIRTKSVEAIQEIFHTQV